MPKKRRVKKTRGKKKKNVRSRRRGGRKELRGGGVFENIKKWFVKSAIKVTPVQNMQRGLKATVYDPKTKTTKPICFLPRKAWQEAGVKDKTLDKYYYPKSKW